MRISDWSSDVCSSDLDRDLPHDLVHFVVEGVLGLKAGVFGQIAAGGDAGGFRVDAAEGVRDAKDHRRTVRKQAAKGQRLVKAQGREGELSEDRKSTRLNSSH